MKTRHVLKRWTTDAGGRAVDLPDLELAGARRRSRAAARSSASRRVRRQTIRQEKEPSTHRKEKTWLTKKRQSASRLQRPRFCATSGRAKMRRSSQRPRLLRRQTSARADPSRPRAAVPIQKPEPVRRLGFYRLTSVTWRSAAAFFFAASVLLFWNVQNSASA
jgi:hypothetical protein